MAMSSRPRHKPLSSDGPMLLVVTSEQVVPRTWISQLVILNSVGKSSVFTQAQISQTSTLLRDLKTRV
jgi:hypothetical protein